MPKVSVVIPCYNLGQYLEEAINSVLVQTFKDFEVIVVNDGSTDVETNRIIDSLDKPKVMVVQTTNQGLSAARNNGIKVANGKYILPLDADDKVAPTYLEKAVEIHEQNKKFGIVYCKAMFFGEKSGEWVLPDYELTKMLLDNMIFCSGVFRKEDWETVGGYKSNMVYGWEDYDFWLSIIELKREVYKIPEVLFYYRKRSSSMDSNINGQRLFDSYKQLVKNHKDLYTENSDLIFEHIYSLRESISRLKEEISTLEHRQAILEVECLDWRVLSHLLVKSIAKKVFSMRRLA